MAEAPHDWLDAHSRELALTCAPDGRVVWADRRAQRHLGVSVGDALPARAAPGTEEKLLELLRRGATEEVTRWEVPLVTAGRVVTLLFSACPYEGKVALLGSLVPDDSAAVLQQVSDAMSEIVGLNREVARQRRELQAQNASLTRANRELSDAHQGVLALLGELEEQAESARRVAEARRRVVSHVSHEFRTPVAAIQSLSKMLLGGFDGTLNAEQTRQVGFIDSSAAALAELVDDILDLAKLESGRASLRSERFPLGEFISSVRGILRPLLPDDAPVQLHFDEVPADVLLDTDRGKLGQIVRNLVSNALKFTERGEVRVSCTVTGEALEVRVRDTGLGIAPEDQAKIFEEFSQVASAQGRARSKGTGLGLPLSRALATRLGGTLKVTSTVGEGSTFTLRLPLEHPDVAALAALQAQPVDPAKRQVLIVEDDREELLSYAQALQGTVFQPVPVRSIEQAHAALARVRPAAVLIDVLLERETSWSLLRHLKETPTLGHIPVFVATITDREETALALGADGFFLKPVDPAALLERLRTATDRNPR